MNCNYIRNIINCQNKIFIVDNETQIFEINNFLKQMIQLSIWDNMFNKFSIDKSKIKIISLSANK